MGKLIVCNWKQFPDNIAQAESFIEELAKSIKKYKLEKILKQNNFVILVPFLFIDRVNELAKKHKLLIDIGSQDVSKFNQGAYTGEISSKMLKSINIKYALIGHSERRLNFKEKNEDINLKISNCLHYGLKPIICIGENVRLKNESSNNFRIKKIVFTQLNEIFKTIKPDLLKDINIAYEPVWSISTSKNHQDAIPEDIETMALNIKFWLENRFGKKISSQIKILYGGSINSNNIINFKTIMLDGFLIGKASTKVKDLISIIKQLTNIK